MDYNGLKCRDLYELLSFVTLFNPENRFVYKISIRGTKVPVILQRISGNPRPKGRGK